MCCLFSFLNCACDCQQGHGCCVPADPLPPSNEMKYFPVTSLPIQYQTECFKAYLTSRGCGCIPSLCGPSIAGHMEACCSLFRCSILNPKPYYLDGTQLSSTKLNQSVHFKAFRPILESCLGFNDLGFRFRIEGFRASGPLSFKPN